MWLMMPVKLKNTPLTYQQIVNMAFKKYRGVLMKLFLDDFNIFNDLKTHLAKTLIVFQEMSRIQY
jgi:hypothetical protein